MKQIKTNGQSLIVVSVPKNTLGIYIDGGAFNLNYYTPRSDVKSVCLEEIDPPYKILGTVTKDHIDFDVGEFVECISANNSWYRNYMVADCNYEECFCKSKDKSFYSILQVNGFCFVNPFGEESETYGRHKEVKKKWQSAQASLVEKVIVIEKIISNS